MSLSNHDVFTAYDLDLTIQGTGLVFRIWWNERRVAGPEDTLFFPHTDAKLETLLPIGIAESLCVMVIDGMIRTVGKLL